MRYIAVVLLWVAAVHAQGSGYRLTANQLVINRAGALARLGVSGGDADD